MRVIIAMVISLVLTACVTENQKSLSKDTRGLGQVSKNSKSEQRVALVIGNKDYSSLNPLKNPINDARALRDILSKKRFNVIYLENASQMEMEDAIDKFGYKIKNGKGVGLFYYAGHGMEVDGVNYLIPTDGCNLNKYKIYPTNSPQNCFQRPSVEFIARNRNILLGVTLKKPKLRYNTT